MMKLKFVNHENYLEAVFYDDRATAVKALKEIHKKAIELNQHRVLIDATTASGEYWELDKYDIGVAISELFKYPFKVAAVEAPENITKFSEDTAVNRGASYYVAFSIEEGLEWLLKES